MAGGFESTGLAPEILRAVDGLGWRLPSDVQDECIPLIMGGGDVMAAAPTGSGKTGAFCLPIVQMVHERRRQQLEAEGAGGAGGLVLAGFSADDRDAGLAVSAAAGSPDLLHAACGALVWAGGRGALGVTNGGRHCYEATVSGDGIPRVGWSTMACNYTLGKDGHGCVVPPSLPPHPPFSPPRLSPTTPGTGTVAPR